MKVLVFCAKGFETMEFSVFIDVLGWARNDYGYDIQVETCGFQKEVISTFNVPIIVNKLMEEIDVNDYSVSIFLEKKNNELLNIISNNKFEFDLKWDNTEQSALKEAKSEANIGGEAIGEMEVVVDNLTADNSTARHIKIVNTSEFDKSKPLAEKLKSENPDEVMTAINNEIMTDYVNPLTGKKMPITEIASFVLRYTRENPLMGKDEIAGNDNL